MRGLGISKTVSIVNIERRSAPMGRPLSNKDPLVILGGHIADMNERLDSVIEQLRRIAVVLERIGDNQDEEGAN